MMCSLQVYGFEGRSEPPAANRQRTIAVVCLSSPKSPCKMATFTWRAPWIAPRRPPVRVRLAPSGIPATAWALAFRAPLPWPMRGRSFPRSLARSPHRVVPVGRGNRRSGADSAAVSDSGAGTKWNSTKERSLRTPAGNRLRHRRRGAPPWRSAAWMRSARRPRRRHLRAVGRSSGRDRLEDCRPPKPMPSAPSRQDRARPLSSARRR
jgi:hypothetical protein